MVAAYATVKITDPVSGKWTVHGFTQGGVFPAEADPENVANLVRRGYAEWVDAPAPTAPAEPAAPPEAPPVEPVAPDGRPKDYASKPEWVDYAVSRRSDDVSEEDARAVAELSSKADLIAEFG